MVNRIVAYFVALASAALLAACAAPGPQPGEMEIRTGVIEQISAVQLSKRLLWLKCMW